MHIYVCLHHMRVICWRKAEQFYMKGRADYHNTFQVALPSFQNKTA